MIIEVFYVKSTVLQSKHHHIPKIQSLDALYLYQLSTEFCTPSNKVKSTKRRNQKCLLTAQPGLHSFHMVLCPNTRGNYGNNNLSVNYQLLPILWPHNNYKYIQMCRELYFICNHMYASDVYNQCMEMRSFQLISSV